MCEHPLHSAYSTSRAGVSIHFISAQDASKTLHYLHIWRVGKFWRDIIICRHYFDDIGRVEWGRAEFWENRGILNEWIDQLDAVSTAAATTSSRHYKPNKIQTVIVINSHTSSKRRRDRDALLGVGHLSFGAKIPSPCHHQAWRGFRTRWNESDGGEGSYACKGKKAGESKGPCSRGGIGS